MATVTGYTTPIDTSTFAAAFGTGKLEVLYVWSGIIGFEIGGQRIVNLYGDFDFTSMKTLAVSPVTGIEVTLTDENETPVMEVTDMSVPFGAFDKGDMRLVLAGDDTITGSTVADRLFGHDGNDVVDGRAGDDLLDGGKGADVMLGGPGDDVYIVDNKRDVVVELPGEGIDTVRSTAAFTLPEHVENLELLGKAKAGTGNDLANVITGNAGKNTLLGGAGDDTLIGLGGKDILEGGLGADRFVGSSLPTAPTPFATSHPRMATSSISARWSAASRPGSPRSPITSGSQQARRGRRWPSIPTVPTSRGAFWPWRCSPASTPPRPRSRPLWPTVAS